MDIKTISAIQNYANAKPATEPSGSGSTADTAKVVIGNFASVLAESEDVAKQSMIGNADPHALITALAQTELAVDTAVSVRNKVVEAYQEILRMPV
jgi:flagellar hook-basal body complex protein FliE